MTSRSIRLGFMIVVGLAVAAMEVFTLCGWIDCAGTPWEVVRRYPFHGAAAIVIILWTMDWLFFSVRK